MINLIVKIYHIIGYFEGKILHELSYSNFSRRKKFSQIIKSCFMDKINVYSKYSGVKFSQIAIDS